MILTETDNHAVFLRDSDYINNKGANLYRPGTYKDAVEYYRLAAAMGIRSSRAIFFRAFPSMAGGALSRPRKRTPRRNPRGKRLTKDVCRDILVLCRLSDAYNNE